MSIDISIQTRVLAYVEERKFQQEVQRLDLSNCNLSGLDLSNLDFTEVDLSHADLTGASLEGARLQDAILTQTCFQGISIAALLATGLAPKDILLHRSAADRNKFAPLHFSPQDSSFSPIRLLARECVQVCRQLSDLGWQDLNNERIFGVLYPSQPWDTWMAGCANRAILDWALTHRATLLRYMDRVPFYGRVLPTTLLDEVEVQDLVAGTKTNPERVFHAVGLRQIIKQSDLQGTDIAYPLAPFGDAENVVQIKSRKDLQLEGGFMHHCVASYDSYCLVGQRFIYHLGPLAPAGSTVEIFPGGRVGQHRAERNRAPAIEERQLLAQWLESLGFAHETGTTMERVCGRLQQEGIVKVAFQIYWYNDEDSINDVEACDQEGRVQMLQTVSDEDLWDLAREEHGDAHGRWELDVEAKRLKWVGEEQPPDDDDYNDEPDDEEYEEYEE